MQSLGVRLTAQLANMTPFHIDDLHCEELFRRSQLDDQNVYGVIFKIFFDAFKIFKCREFGEIAALAGFAGDITRWRRERINNP
jgi:hypothetical protein